MGGDLSAVVASTSRRPRTSMCLVKAGSRPVQIATPAFQFSGSAELQRRCFLSSGRLRLPSSTFGGFATSVPHPAAVAALLVMAGLTGHLIANGAVNNINISVYDSVNCLPLR